jgi:hypothetical protein
MPGILDMIPMPTSSPAAELFIVGKPKGIVEKGNINILARPQVKLPDGSIATVRSLSFSDDTGNEILIPTVSPDGKIMSEREAIDYYYKTGQHLGKFKTPDAASSYAEKLHQQQAKYYGVK